MRESGFYWVQKNFYVDWRIAEFNKESGGYWWVTGSEDSYKDSYFYKINETRINQ